MTAVPPPPKPVAPPPRPPGRLFLLMLFLAALAWIAFSSWISSSSATGLCVRFDVLAFEPVLAAIFRVFLLVVGFAMLQVLAKRRSSPAQLLALPQRSTASREWALGTLLGWGAAIAVVLPLALTRALHMQVSLTLHDAGLALLSVVALVLLAFAEETAFRGYPYRLLTEVTGPTAATVLMAVFFGIVSAAQPFSSPLSVLVTMLLGLVLATGWLRTHALRLSWGLNFAFKAAAAILFGLPVAGSTSYSSVVQTYASGSRGWAGGSYGLLGSWLVLLVLPFVLVVLLRLTRDYAWSYTHRPIMPGGYPVEMAPPAAHTAMEQQAAAQAPALVQILPVAPVSPSLLPTKDHIMPEHEAN